MKSDLVFNISEFVLFVFGSGANGILLCASVHRVRKESTQNSISLSTYLVMFHISVDFFWAISSLIGAGYCLPRETFSDQLCRVFGFLHHVVAATFMTFMVIMAYERYLTIVRGPGTATNKHMIYLVGTCNLGCVGYAILPILDIGMYDKNETTYTCFARKKPDLAVDPFLVISLVIIFSCISLISLLNYLIFRHVRAVTAAVSRATGRSSLSVEVEVAKSFLFSVCFFIFAWAPLAILWIMQLLSFPYSQAMLQVALLNGTSYSIGNPILYVVFNKNVRKMVWEILPASCSEWLDRKSNEPSSDVSSPALATLPRTSTIPAKEPVSPVFVTPYSITIVRNGQDKPAQP